MTRDLTVSWAPESEVVFTLDWEYQRSDDRGMEQQHGPVEEVVGPFVEYQGQEISGRRLVPDELIGRGLREIPIDDENRDVEVDNEELHDEPPVSSPG